MGTETIDEIRTELTDMKTMIAMSERRMNESIIKLSTIFSGMSSRKLNEMDHVKTYVKTVLKGEERKMGEETDLSEFQIENVMRRSEGLQSRIAITLHECIHRNTV